MLPNESQPQGLGFPVCQTGGLNILVLPGRPGGSLSSPSTPVPSAQCPVWLWVKGLLSYLLLSLLWSGVHMDALGSSQASVLHSELGEPLSSEDWVLRGREGGRALAVPDLPPTGPWACRIGPPPGTWNPFTLRSFFQQENVDPERPSDLNGVTQNVGDTARCPD